MNQPIITTNDLAALGVESNDSESLLQHLNEKLEERVGIAITEVLTNEQLRELIALQDQGDDEAVGEWLNENISNLQQIAEDERDILLGELAQNADEV